MIASLFSRSRSHAQRFVVEKVTDRTRLDHLLRSDRLLTAYAIAQLEERTFTQSEWWVTQTVSGTSLVCHSRAGLGKATLALGPAEGVEAILAIHPGGFHTFVTAQEEHLPALAAVYTLNGPHTMLRMHVTRHRFEQVPGETVPLSGRDVTALNRLYGSDGLPAAYQPTHINEGHYRGVIEHGRLVAVAGTHAISHRYGIAVVGNVFTHPDYRGQGCATLASSAVTAALLETCADVVLSVDPTNTPAIRAYRHLGYAAAGPIVEAAARRRGTGLSSSLRRWLASARGRGSGCEIVHR